MSGFSSLDAMRKKQEEEEKKKDKGQEFYAGGVDQRGGGSGLAVQDPKKPLKEDDIMSRIVQRAQENSSSSSSSSSEETSTRITIWSNGFQINGGDFRPDSDPANRVFLTTLASGFVPEELRGGATDQLSIALEDKRAEEYSPPPPPPYVAFGGDAFSLGSGSRSSLAAVFTPSEFTALPEIKEESGAASTVIQVKLLDGKKLKIK